MTGFGLTHPQIAAVIGISDETLRKYYRTELDTGAALANSRVAQNLYKIATSDGTGAVSAAIFWAKARMGWRETQRQELTGPNGGPIETADSSLALAGEIINLLKDRKRNAAQTIDATHKTPALPAKGKP
jgi:hypothetical protein